MVHPLRRGEIHKAIEVAGQFDAVQDVPWACLFKELDKRYPNSKFVITIREEEDWLRSARRHFGSTEIPLHQWIYGQGKLIGNEERYLERFRMHHDQVKDYFADRQNDLLIMNLQQGDQWEKLCEFLGIDAPRHEFPHENKSPMKLNLKERLVNSLKKSVPMIFRSYIFSFRLQVRKSLGKSDPRNRFHNFRENKLERDFWE